MSTILEFYVEKEKRELINTINSAKYISEDQKEAMIEIFGFSAAEKAKRKSEKDKEEREKDARALERHRKQIKKDSEEKAKGREKVHAQDRADREKRGPVGDRGGRIVSS